MLKYSVLIIAIFSWVTVWATCGGDITESEYTALHDLYLFTDGSNWKWNSTSGEEWVFPSSLDAPCSGWHGVVCEQQGEFCGVTELNLTEFGLKGLLPQSISDLNSLKNLSFGGNHLFGTISEAIGDLKLLRVLDLSYNLLTSSIPSSLFSLTELIVLDLEYNYLSGSIPKNISQLTNLASLELSSNALTSTFPPEMAELNNLKELYCGYTNLEGIFPSCLCSVTSIQVIDLEFSYLTGWLPSCIGNLSNLLGFQVSTNQFTGPIPIEVGKMQALSGFIVSQNLLSRRIPTQLCELSGLTSLFLSENDFSGTVPACVWQMGIQEVLLFQNSFTGSLSDSLCDAFNMTQLMIYNNGLTGSLPECMGTLRQLHFFSAHSNQLTGRIPPGLVNIIDLSEWDLSNNRLTGVIPDAVCSLSILSEFYIFENFVTGPIPSCFAQLNEMRNLDLSTNFLTGMLPRELVMANLAVFTVYLNMLTGWIPPALANMTKLTYISLGANQFEGTIPVEFNNLVNLENFAVNFNRLSGTIGSLFSRMSKIHSILLNDCMFSGSIPVDFNSSSTTSLEYVQLQNNYFTGSLPSVYFTSVIYSLYISYNSLTGSIEAWDWPQWRRLDVFQFDNNLFSGTIPYSISHLNRLECLTAGSNFLSGTIPSILSNLTRVEYVEMGFNYLSGKIPTELGDSLRKLEILNMTTNLLNGDLNSLVASNISLPRLVSLDLSSNSFTGSLPPNLFAGSSTRIDTLRDVILYSNCFDSTSMTPDICSATNLTTLVLDSISTAPSCQVSFGPFLDKIFKVIVSKTPGTSTIPSCIWTMSKLQTVHLSGNGLQGSLVDIDFTVSKLTDVSLASNRLVGTLPVSWQTSGVFSQLDLSSNKLSGSLSEGFNIYPNMTTINLSINRISGNIPPVFHTAKNINILDGNMFQCSGHSKPEFDPNSKEYVCGSADFDVSLYVFAICFICVVIGIALGIGIMYVCLGQWKMLMLVELFASKRTPCFGIAMSQLTLLHESFAMMCTMLCLLFLSIGMSSFIIMKRTESLSVLFSTYSFQFTWITTVAFLHGVLPTVIVSLLVLCSIVVVQRIISPFQSYIGGSAINEHAMNKVPSLLSPVLSDRYAQSYLVGYSRRIILASLTIMLHMAVTVSCNVAYIYALIRGINPNLLVLIQVLLSLFKLSWNHVYVFKAVALSGISENAQAMSSSFMTLFTFLVSPVIATFFLDYTCFRYVVTGQPSVASSFLSLSFMCRSVCEFDQLGQGFCIDNCFIGTPEYSYSTVTPSWLYSYQCSSSLLTNYIPVLLFAYIASGVAIPGMRLIIWLYFEKDPQKLTLQRYLPSIKQSSSNVALTKQETKDSFTHVKSYIKCPQIMSRLILNLTVLLTFGIACPLLVIAICFDCWAMLVSWNLKMFKLNSLNTSLRDLSDTFPINISLASLAHDIENECVIMLKTINGRLWMSVVFCSFFWSFFVFDMLGDVYGSLTGGVMILASLFICLSVFFAAVKLNKTNSTPAPPNSSPTSPIDFSESCFSDNSNY